MTTYKTIRGTHIVSVTSDPPSPVNGQMWYNSTDGAIKGFTSNPVGSWATGGALNTARDQVIGTGTTNSSALAISGATPTVVANNESYNGSSWTELSDLNQAKSGGAANGTTTSSLYYGGNPVPISNTESWNGSSWTEVNNLNNFRGATFGGAGVDNTSALAFGGYDNVGSPIAKTYTESWNGTSWTEVNDMNTARYALADAGIQTSALGFGGRNPGGPFSTNNITESWNGTSWTEVADLNTNRAYAGGAGDSNTSALAFGGEAPPDTVNTEDWNGSSWTELSNMSTARNRLAGSGTTSSALAAGGLVDPNPQSATEEFTAPLTNTVTFTVS